MIARHSWRSVYRLPAERHPTACSRRYHSSPVWRRNHSNIVKPRPFRMAVIGSGPAGFYCASRVISRITDAVVDMYEQLPVPYGLVRFGVAPDHPEVKNCQDRFTEIAESSRFNFIGNVEIGKDLSLFEMRPHYDAILFSYGASQDRELGIPGEHLDGVYSARAFVGWYNGLPEYADLAPKLDAGDTAVVIGQGNVALDVARVLLSGVDRLKNTDITESALETLAKSKVKRVHIVGRRGPMQASFTIKEVRELLQMPDIAFEPIPQDQLPNKSVKLSRAPRRIADLLLKHSGIEPPSAPQKKWSLDFLRSPKELKGTDHVSSMVYEENQYVEGNNPFDCAARVAPSGNKSSLDCSLVFRSIGYKAVPLPEMEDTGILFDHRSGTIVNEGGRVKNSDGFENGVYCAGWVKNGPTGVIATTMEDAFATAEAIVEDWQGKSSQVHGWDALRGQLLNAVGWKGWRNIDEIERERGEELGKEREKFTRTKDMLNAQFQQPRKATYSPLKYS